MKCLISFPNIGYDIDSCNYNSRSFVLFVNLIALLPKKYIEAYSLKFLRHSNQCYQSISSDTKLENVC